MSINTYFLETANFINILLDNIDEYYGSKIHVRQLPDVQYSVIESNIIPTLEDIQDSAKKNKEKNRSLISNIDFLLFHLHEYLDKLEEFFPSKPRTPEPSKEDKPMTILEIAVVIGLIGITITHLTIS